MMCDSRRFYTKKEMDYIKKNFKKKSYNEIASRLERSSRSIENKLRKLGLKKRPQNYKKIEKMIIKEPQLRRDLQRMYCAVNQKIRIIRRRNPKIRLATFGNKDTVYFFDTPIQRIKAFKLVIKKYPCLFQKNRWVQAKGILGGLIKTSSSSGSKVIVSEQ